MQRRTVLKVGLAASVALAAAGSGLAWWMRSVPGPFRLSPEHREIFRAVGRAVLEGSLPPGADVASRTLEAHLDRVEIAIAGFPPLVRAEAMQLLAVLANPIGRRMLGGLATPWAEAGVEQVQHALESMRFSRLALRQQAYHALRDFTNGAYYAEPGTWALLDYPGPRDV